MLPTNPFKGGPPYQILRNRGTSNIGRYEPIWKRIIQRLRPNNSHIYRAPNHSRTTSNLAAPWTPRWRACSPQTALNLGRLPLPKPLAKSGRPRPHWTLLQLGLCGIAPLQSLCGLIIFCENKLLLGFGLCHLLFVVQRGKYKSRKRTKYVWFGISTRPA